MPRCRFARLCIQSRNPSPCCVLFAGTLVNQSSAAMAEQDSTNASTARKLNTTLSHIKAVNARLDADCTSMLCVTDLRTANLSLQPVFELSDSLVSRQSVELDEAMVYLREARLCELLLSLLRRWPWAQMQQERAVPHKDLALLPKLLSSLCAFLCVAGGVRSRQQAAAYAEMRRRCPRW